MRVLILVLLAVNALVLYWNVQAHRRVETPLPSKTVAPPPRFDRVTTLPLLSEVDTAELRVRGAEPEPPPDPVPALAAAPAPESEAQTCVSLGPLTDEEQVSAIGSWFEELGLQMVSREGKLRELTRYWVYLPPFATMQETRAVAERLRTQGVQDLHIIHRGDMANALSLGVYSREASMHRRVSALATLGFEAKVSERQRVQKATWLDVSLPADGVFTVEAMRSDPHLGDVGIGPCPQLLRASALPTIAPAPGIAAETSADTTSVPE